MRRLGPCPPSPKPKPGFVSRGDDSGTHTKEQALWEATGLALENRNHGDRKEAARKQAFNSNTPKGSANGISPSDRAWAKRSPMPRKNKAYTMTDRGTYLKYKFGRDQRDSIWKSSVKATRFCSTRTASSRSTRQKYPHVKYDRADEFAKWLVSEKVQAIIANYKIEGQQAFFPDAVPNAK